MRRAIYMTAYNRVDYLREALASWDTVRHLHDWHFVARIEPSPVQGQIVSEFEAFRDRNLLPDFEIVVNAERLGVLHHPWVAFEELFNAEYDFVVHAEDDMLVTDDILEYFEWASENFKGSDHIASVQAFNLECEGDFGLVREDHGFDAWTFGTWRNRWVAVIGPTWDHDYSTYNGWPGNESGWDWHLNTRIYPKLGLKTLRPAMSRTDNIGYWGTHGTPDNILRPKEFTKDIEPCNYRLSDGNS